MKYGKWITAAALVLTLGASTAQAGGYNGGHGGGYHGGYHGGGYGGGYYGHSNNGAAIALGITGAFFGAALLADAVAPRYYAPPVAYAVPPPVYYQPAPVYYRPAPVYYQPAPVYYGPRW